MSQLELRSLSVSYGGVQALRDVDLTVPPGRLVGLIGPNGAGKTTLLDAVNGVARSTGRIELDGVDLAGLPAHRRAQAGLARVWQSTELFEELTVAHNIRVVTEQVTVWSALKDLIRGHRAEASERIGRAVELLELEAFLSRRPSELSHGQQKLVGVARALAAGATTLLLDEPAAGLDRAESTKLGECLRRIVATGVSILLIEHDMELVLSVCDELYVLEWGQIIAHGTPDEVRQDPRVREAYLGQRATSQEVMA